MGWDKKYAVVRFTHEDTTESKRRFQAQVLEMRSAGMSFEAIGRALGKSQKYCYTMYAEAINAIIAPGVELLRKQEAERLDMMLVPCMSKIMAARNAAIAGEPYNTPEPEIMLALKISERRARFFGLDAPTKIAALKNPSETIEALMNLTSMGAEELEQLRALLAKAAEVEVAANDSPG